MQTMQTLFATKIDKQVPPHSPSSRPWEATAPITLPPAITGPINEAQLEMRNNRALTEWAGPTQGPAMLRRDHRRDSVWTASGISYKSPELIIVKKI